MKVMITGSNGFIGKNLISQLSVRDGFEILQSDRSMTDDVLAKMISEADFICHLAGVNRPENDTEFFDVNVGYTQKICLLARKSGQKTPIIFTSSVHTEKDNPYGKSKVAAEQELLRYSEQTNAPVFIFRLSHVIGKWCRPNYNSVVATFCHNIARDIPIDIHDPDYELELVYIDDLVDCFAGIMDGGNSEDAYYSVDPSYKTTVGELASQIKAFRNSRNSLISERVGKGLVRALYSTYMSYLPPEEFSYELTKHGDERGAFVEIQKTLDSGQFSFFTAHPGVTRGGHYHHSKTEKFLIVKGKARFRFRNIDTQELHEICTSEENPKIVETIPGWSHDVTNIGDGEIIVFLWANEIFDRDRPDTYVSKVYDE